jgi:hypothetical protein
VFPRGAGRRARSSKGRCSMNDLTGSVANVEMTTPITFDLQGVISIYIHV